MPGGADHEYPGYPTLDVLRGIALQVFVEPCFSTVKPCRLRIAVKRANGVGHLRHIIGVSCECPLQCGIGLMGRIQCIQECCEIIL